MEVCRCCKDEKEGSRRPLGKVHTSSENFHCVLFFQLADYTHGKTLIKLNCACPSACVWKRNSLSSAYSGQQSLPFANCSGNFFYSYEVSLDRKYIHDEQKVIFPVNILKEEVAVLLTSARQLSTSHQMLTHPFV